MDLGIGEVQRKIVDSYSPYFSIFSVQNEFDDKDTVLGIVQQLFDKANFDIREKEKIIDNLTTIHRVLLIYSADYSVMLFELLIVLFIFLPGVDGKKNLNKLATIADTNYAGLDREMGVEYYNYVRDLFENSIETIEQVHASYSAKNYVANSTVSLAICLIRRIILEDTDNKVKEEFREEVILCNKIYEMILLFF